MKIFALVSITLSLLAFTCNKETIVPPAELSIKVNSCKDSTLYGEQVRICLDSVLTDSRCPSDAVCVTRGEASARFTFNVNGQSLTKEISLKNFNINPSSTELVFNGYLFEFANLRPYPVFSLPHAYQEYAATVAVTKL